MTRGPGSKKRRRRDREIGPEKRSLKTIAKIEGDEILESLVFVTIRCKRLVKRRRDVGFKYVILYVSGLVEDRHIGHC